MAELLVDDLGRPIPQYLNEAGTAFEAERGADGALKDRSDDGAHATLGHTTEAAAAAGGDGSVSAKLRRLTTDLDALNTLVGALSSAAVADPTLSGALNALLKGILTDLGQTTDAVVAAGADGSISAKLKRLTTDLDAINTKAATLATEATVATQLDLTISALRDAIAGVAPATVGNLGLLLDKLDVALSTRATETTLASIKDTDGIKKITDAVDVADRVARLLGHVSVDSSALPTGAATEAKQDALIAKDFATQTTLAAILAKIIDAPATEAKQDSIIGYIDTLETLLTAIRNTDGIKKIVDALPTGDNTVGRVKVTDGTTVTAVDSATQRLKTDAVITGNFATIDSAPVVGKKTVGSTAAELFAGATSKLSNRYLMAVFNESANPVYWGPSDVTAAAGFPLLPQDSIVFHFNPAVATAIYFIAGADSDVRVVEWA